MKRLVGVIDIGSNSVRLLLAEIGEENTIRILNELKEYVRLGDGLDNNDVLSEEKIQLAINTLDAFKNVCTAFEVSEIVAVATEAVRRAKNQQVFLDRVKEELGLNIRVLSGTEEAFYDYFGTINSMVEKNTLIMDIGGASTELILVKNRKLIKSISLPFGAITLTQRFDLSDGAPKEQEEELNEFLQKNFKKLDWLKEAEGFNLIGIGGSIRTIGKIHRKSVNYPLTLLHNYTMPGKDVISIYEDMKSKSNVQRKKIKGLSSDRSDIMVGAAKAISAIIEMCSIKNVIISRNGIREGLLFSYICKNNRPIEDVLQFSLNNIIVNHNINLKHAEHIHHLFSSLNTELQSLYNTDENLSNIIKTAAILHDVGINITYYYHHLHSLYIILNSQINGLTHKELVMSAFVTANHRDDNSTSINYSDYEGIINKDDIEIIKKLGLLLKIAENLDKSMTGLIKDIKCNLAEDTVIIKTISDFHPSLEIREAQVPAQEFKKIFGKKLYIV